MTVKRYITRTNAVYFVTRTNTQLSERPYVVRRVKPTGDDSVEVSITYVDSYGVDAISGHFFATVDGEVVLESTQIIG